MNFQEIGVAGIVDTGLLEDAIFPNLTLRYGLGGRVENLQLYASIARVCKRWRDWVFDAQKGPFKQLGKDIAKIKMELKGGVEIGRFLGVLNRALQKNSSCWFEKIEALKTGSPACFLEYIDPNITVYGKQSALTVAVELVLKHPQYWDLLKRWRQIPVEAQVLDLAFRSIIASLDHDQGIKNGKYQREAIFLFEMSKNVSKEEGGQLYFLDGVARQVIGREKLYIEDLLWLQEHGLKWTKDLLTWATSLRNENVSVELFRFFLEHTPLLDYLPAEDEDHLIHKLFRKPHFYQEEFFEYILERYPNEISAISENGKTPICCYIQQRGRGEYFFDFSVIKKYINEEHLWVHRKSIAFTIINNWQDLPNELFVNHPHRYDERLLSVLSEFKTLFSLPENFESWLLAQEGEEISLLHQLALISPYYIQALCSQGVITETQLQEERLKFICESQPVLLKCLADAGRGDAVSMLTQSIDLTLMKQLLDLYKRLYGEPFLFSVVRKARNEHWNPEGSERLLADSKRTEWMRFVEVIQLIVEWSEDPNCFDRFQRSVLHMLASNELGRQGSPNYIAFEMLLTTLIDLGVDPTIRDKTGRRALDCFDIRIKKVLSSFVNESVN